MVTAALSEVTKTIFPHKTFESQKAWLEKLRKKLKDMKIRALAANLNKIYICLSLFSKNLKSSKFTPAELIESLECLLPFKWEQRFDLNGYIFTDKTRA